MFIIKTRKNLWSDDLVTLCQARNFYTCGNCQEYDELLKKVDSIDNITDNDLLEIAKNIISHTADDMLEYASPEEALQSIMFAINEKTHTFFEVEAVKV